MTKEHNQRPKLVNAKLFIVSLIMAIIAISVFTVPIMATIVTIQMVDIPKLDEGKLDIFPRRSKILATDGSLLSTIYFENRESVPLGEVPDNFKNAVIAIEDNRFYEHSGIDIRSISRAFLSNVKKGGVVEGGSTITQQYVKNVFLNNEKSVARKIREAALAYQVERRLSKDQILELYLNSVYFGQGAYGTKAASEVYFGKRLDQLDLAETALLAGLTKSPDYLSPYFKPENAKKRRNQVLQAMFDQRYINEADLNHANNQGLNLKPLDDVDPRNSPYFVEYIRRQMIKKIGKKKFLEGGLTVETTLDPTLQSYAKDAIRKNLDRPGDPSASIVSIDPKTGHIKAMIGGLDFRSDEFNLAVQGRRQAGSAFKTFVLVTALEEGMSPNQTFSGSSPITIAMPKPGKDWSVKNYGNSSYGTIPLSEATVKSVNVVFAQLVMRVGARDVAKIAKKMGIRSHVDTVPAIALGGLTIGVSPLDMASAYSTLANSGKHVTPTAITKVTDYNGKTIYKAKFKPKKVLKPEVAYKTTKILQQVVARGTGTNAKIGRPQAGKTGTTEKLSDAWFVGYTPDLSTAVWVGYPKKRVEMNNVHGTSVTGGSFPAKIWNSFMSRALQNTPPTNFKGPDGKEIKNQTPKSDGDKRPRAPKPHTPDPIKPAPTPAPAPRPAPEAPAVPPPAPPNAPKPPDPPATPAPPDPPATPDPPAPPDPPATPDPPTPPAPPTSD